MTQPIPIVVIGAGIVGIRHIQHVVDEPRTSLCAIVDPSPNGKAVAERYMAPYFHTVEDLLAARQRDEIRATGAIVSTPNVTHVPLGKQLVREGIHCLIEKPIAPDIESGRDLIATAREYNARIIVGHHRRFNTYIRALKTILDDGALGEVLAINGMWSLLKPAEYFETPTEWRKEPRSGGTILINLVHDMDLLRYLMGDITRVYCTQGKSTRGFPVEETGFIALTFASGAIGTFIFSDAVASPYSFESATGENPHQNIYTLLGTLGSISFPELKRFHYPNTHSWSEKLAQDAPPEFEVIPPFKIQLQHFVNVIEGKAEPNCSGLEALKGLLVLEAVRKSMMEEVPVDVPQA